MIWRDTHKIDN